MLLKRKLDLDTDLVAYQGDGLGWHHFTIKSGAAAGASFSTPDLSELSINMAFRATVATFESVTCKRILRL